MFHDVTQNTDEWFQLRIGKITSSNLHVIMANYGKAFGDPAKKYAIQIAVEQISGVYKSQGYSNAHMERGHEEEPLARKAYEDEYFCDVTNGGFFDLGDIGCSPDGLVCEDGAIEIKSAIPSKHYERVRKGKIESTAYKWQCCGNLKFTGREWIDFVSYCSSYPEGKQLFVLRMHKDDLVDEFRKIDCRVEQFRDLIKESKENIINDKYFIGKMK